MRLAYGYAVLSSNPGPIHRPYQGHQGYHIFQKVADLLVDRLPIKDRLPVTRQSVYGVGEDKIVYQVVDIIGEVSRMLADAVISQIGSFPPQLRLERFIGPDLVLAINEENRDSLRNRVA